MFEFELKPITSFGFQARSQIAAQTRTETNYQKYIRIQSPIQIQTSTQAQIGTPSQIQIQTQTRIQTQREPKLKLKLRTRSKFGPKVGPEPRLILTLKLELSAKLGIQNQLRLKASFNPLPELKLGIEHRPELTIKLRNIPGPNPNRMAIQP